MVELDGEVSVVKGVPEISGLGPIISFLVKLFVSMMVYGCFTDCPGECKLDVFVYIYALLQ